jgi:hypothetical protein
MCSWRASPAPHISRRRVRRWAGIHIGARLKGLPEFAAQTFRSALRVFRRAHYDSRRPRHSGRSSRAGLFAEFTGGSIDRRGKRRVVIERADDHAARAPASPAWANAAARHASSAFRPHGRARASLADAPARETHCGSDAAEIESRLDREFDGPCREIGICHGSILVGRASACLLLIFAMPP